MVVLQSGKVFKMLLELEQEQGICTWSPHKCTHHTNKTHNDHSKMILEKDPTK